MKILEDITEPMGKKVNVILIIVILIYYTRNIYNTILFNLFKVNKVHRITIGNLGCVIEWQGIIHP